jgi:fumarylacetoacetase
MFRTGPKLIFTTSFSLFLFIGASNVVYYLFNASSPHYFYCFSLQRTLNAFMATGRPTWLEARSTIQHLLSADEPLLRDNQQLREEALVPQNTATMHLPATIGDYTDFFCSKEHAVNCGLMFRGPENPLNPNWLHLPVAYHGRSSSIVISGTNVRRPWGQILPKTTETSESSTTPTAPIFQPSGVLDFELEMGCFIGGPGNTLGEPISINAAVDHMFGFVLLNDWSARDVQKWEYVPLGPFTAKNWATSISPWVVTLEALEPFKTPAPPKDPPPLPYLTPESDSALANCNYDIRLEASIAPSSGGERGGCNEKSNPTPTTPTTITRSNMRTLYWTLPQMIAHHTAGGCNLRPGDLLGTGTLSTAGEGEQGCLLELTWSGTKKILLTESGGGEVERTFLEDGDEVTLTGYCQGEGYRVGFGDCTGKILPALTKV